MSYIKREDVLGKRVITPDGNAFGTVKDLAFSTRGDVGIIMSKKDGSEVTVSVKQVSAIGEFVILSATPESRPPSTPAPAAVPPSVSRQEMCPSCGSQVRPGAKFCGKCGHKLA